MNYLILIPYLMIFVGIGLSYAGLLPAMLGWVLSALAVLLGIGLGITLLINQPLGWLWQAFCSVLPAIVAIPMVINDLRYPRINDIATDVNNPLAFSAALHAGPNSGRDMSFPKGNDAIINDHYPRVRPLSLQKSLSQVFQSIESLAKNQPGWVITRSEASTYTLEGEVTTSVFRFVDDVVIQVSDHQGKALVNMRSKSRDGLVDAGANAKRIELFFEQLKDHK